MDDIRTKQVGQAKEEGILPANNDYYLLHIDIENYAIIKQAGLSFKNGLNVIVGETGTGKSLLIRALYSLATGNVSPLDFRVGSDCISIKAEMYEDGSKREIQRTFNTSGRGRASILGRKTGSRELREMLKGRWVFLKQHAFTQLMSQQFALTTLDRYAGLTGRVNAYTNCFKGFDKLRLELATLEETKRDYLRKKEEHKRELKELDEVRFYGDEKQDIKIKLKRMAAMDEIYAASTASLQLIDGSNYNLTEGMKELISSLKRLNDLEEGRWESFIPALSSSLIEIKELSPLLKDYIEGLSFSAASFDDLQLRLSLLEDLERRFRKTLPELDEYREYLRTLTSDDFSIEDKINEVRAEIAHMQSVLAKEGREISRERKASGVSFKNRMEEDLIELGMSEVEFEINFTQPEEGESTFVDGDDVFSPQGSDEVDFWIAPNKGEGLKPMVEIVSGGEMARIILSIFTLVLDNTKKVFFLDEIDVGVGGQTAHLIADKLLDLSKTHQVICVTHLPQIAKRAQNLILVEKMTEGDRTLAKFTVLDGKDRIKAISNLRGD